MAIVEAFVKRVDVPNQDAATMQRLETRVKVHRLASLDPKQLVASVIAMDALEPQQSWRSMKRIEPLSFTALLAISL